MKQLKHYKTKLFPGDHYHDMHGHGMFSVFDRPERCGNHNDEMFRDHICRRKRTCDQVSQITEQVTYHGTIYLYVLNEKVAIIVYIYLSSFYITDSVINQKY